MGEKILLNQFCCNPLPTTGPVYNSFKANDAPSFNISFFFLLGGIFSRWIFYQYWIFNYYDGGKI